LNEFTVSLRGGRRMVIRADRCVVRPDGLIELVTDPTGEPQIGRFDRPAVVAVFDRGEVEWVAHNGHIVSETQPPGDDAEPPAF
jgi:hypothetical protein